MYIRNLIDTVQYSMLKQFIDQPITILKQLKFTMFSSI